MLYLLAIIVFAVCIISCVGICYYTGFKSDELEYKKEQSIQVSNLTEAETKLEIEREKTKQEVEKTKQLEIKAEYAKENGRLLY